MVLCVVALLAKSARAEDAPTAPPSDAPAPDAPAPEAAAPATPAAMEATTQAAETDVVVQAIRASDVRISGYLQADWVMVRQTSQDEITGATGEPLNENRFLLRRGHLRADVEREWVLGALEIDANTVKGPIVRPIDAEASVRWRRDKEEGSPFIMATLGLFKTPFGFEVLEADNRRPFLERSTVIRALFPGEYDLGARVQGGWRAFTYALGIMNGDPIGERQFPGRDPNKSKDLVFRVGFDTRVVRHVRVQGGFSGVTGSGFHKGSASTKDVLVWRDVNEDGIVQPTEIQVIAGAAATPSQNFHRFAIGGDLRVIFDVPWAGKLTVRTEIVRASNLDRGVQPADPVGAGRDLREFGWTVGATQEIRRWAMVGLRYDRYNPDTDSSNQQGATLVPKDASFATLGVMGLLQYSGGRLILQYDHNTNALGRTVAGLPTTLADDTLTLRAQVTF